MITESESLKTKLQSGCLALGSWITLPNPAVAEIFARAGYDWLVVDLEHSTLTIEQAGELIRVIELAGSAPLVRLTSNEPNQIKRVMDAGAHGIVVPMVNTPQDAVEAVSSTRYAPAGIRGVGLARAQGYGVNFKEYLKWQENGPVVIVQIEHKLALDSLEEILNVDGVDGYIIGPYDLSCSMGIPGQFDHVDFIEAMDFIKHTGFKIDKPGGLHVVEPDQKLLNQTIEAGFRFVAYSVDVRMLDTCARSGLKNIREK